MAEQQETLLKFPCDFAIKAMGETSGDFDGIVVSIISKHVDTIKEGAVTTKQSSGGKYTSVTVSIYATSKAQVDAIYHELNAHEAVKYLL